MAARGSNRKSVRQAESPFLAGLPESLCAAAEKLIEAVSAGDEATHEAGLMRFLEEGFSKLEQVPASAAFLARLYEGSESWLARRVQTQELIQELSSGQAMLTCVVAGEWVMERDFVKLTRLADGMLAARQHLRAPDCLDLMLATASSLALMKNTRAASLLHHVEDCQAAGAEVDGELLREARRRVVAGTVIAAADQATREMWDQRLEKPAREWSWSSPQERQALRDLAEWLEPGHPATADFARLVPPAWWDLWMRQEEAVTESTPAEPPPVAAAPAATNPPEKRGEVASWAGARLGGAEDGFQSIGSEWRSRLGWFLGGGVAGVLAAMLFGRGGELPEKPVTPMVPKAVPAGPRAAAGWLNEERERLAGELEHVGRLGTVKAANWSENAAFLTGRTPQLPAQSQMYRNLLTLLHLDPPQDAETRARVPRLLLMRAADEETVRLWERCVEADSGMTPEIAAAAREALNQPSLPWTAQQRERLERLAEKGR